MNKTNEGEGEQKHIQTADTRILQEAFKSIQFLFALRGMEYFVFHGEWKDFYLFL